jgi:hypothetical protein
MEVLKMKVAMVKHAKSPKVFWFGVPEHLAEDVFEGVQVLCDTRKGVQPGTVICTVKDCDTVKEMMRATGAVFPLKNIVGVASSLAMDAIKIPGNMEKTPPKDEKLAARFLEYYHTGEFNTFVRVSHDMVLKDGYSAYLVAKFLNMMFITGLREEK